MKSRTDPNLQVLPRLLSKNEINQIDYKYFDIDQLLRIIRTGERMLFNNALPFTLTKQDIKYLNSKVPYYKKLTYITQMPYFTN